jgi:hypothetical protein
MQLGHIITINRSKLTITVINVIVNIHVNKEQSLTLRISMQYYQYNIYNYKSFEKYYFIPRFYFILVCNKNENRFTSTCADF